MTTLIAVYDITGCVGRCDANCYNAHTLLRCTCICGGRNHSVGEMRARENVSNGVGFCDQDILDFAGHPRDLPASELFVVDRTKMPDAKEARAYAYQKLTQHKFDFEYPGEHADV